MTRPSPSPLPSSSAPRALPTRSWRTPAHQTRSGADGKSAPHLSTPAATAQPRGREVLAVKHEGLAVKDEVFAMTHEVFGSKRARALGQSLRRFLRDERGGEVLEYVFIAGLIIVGCIAAVTAFGGKVLTRWNSVNDAAL